MRKEIVLSAIVVLFILSMGMLAYAAVWGGSTTWIQEGNYTQTTAGQDVTEGGNVTMMNISATVSTDRWAGYYGNVSGRLALGLGASIFYQFTGTPLSVFASQDQNFDFSMLDNGTAQHMDGNWSYTSGNDQAIDIYTTTTVMSNVTDAPTVRLYPLTVQWNSTLLSNGSPTDKNGWVFGVNVSSANTCFDGTTCDYSLMVPASGQETYYFFVEI